MNEADAKRLDDIKALPWVSDQVAFLLRLLDAANAKIAELTAKRAEPPDVNTAGGLWIEGARRDGYQAAREEATLEEADALRAKITAKEAEFEAQYAGLNAAAQKQIAALTAERDALRGELGNRNRENLLLTTERDAARAALSQIALEIASGRKPDMALIQQLANSLTGALND